MQYNKPDWATIIRRHLNEKGWSQSQLARQIGCSTSSLTQVLRRNSISPAMLTRISHALGTDLLVYLISDESRMLFRKAEIAKLSQIPEGDLAKMELGRVREDRRLRVEAESKTKDLEARIQNLEAQLLREQHERQVEVTGLTAKLEVYQELSRT